MVHMPKFRYHQHRSYLSINYGMKRPIDTLICIPLLQWKSWTNTFSLLIFYLSCIVGKFIVSEPVTEAALPKENASLDDSDFQDGNRLSPRSPTPPPEITALTHSETTGDNKPKEQLPQQGSSNVKRMPRYLATIFYLS